VIEKTLEMNELDVDRRGDRVAERFAQPVLPPKDVRVVREGDVLHIVVRDRGRFVDAHGLSGADHYAIYWAEAVDESTTDGVDAGAARASHIGAVQRAWIEDKELTFDVTNARHQNGYFFIYGQNVLGDRSERYLFTGKQSNAVLDSTIPGDVAYLTISESGIDERGVVVSRIDWRFYRPYGSSYNGVQWVLKDYPNLGDVTRYIVQDNAGGPEGGLATGFFTAMPARRVGIGTITIAGANVTVAGGKLLTQAQAGDLIEILGVQATILSVTNNTTMTLTAAWTGQPMAGYAEWVVIGLVTVYANSISKAGTYKDYTTAPSAATHFDAQLSPPLQPTLTATPGGNVIRLYGTIASGVALEKAVLFRGTGAAVAFADCVPIDTRTSEQIRAAGPTLVFEDSNFTTYERENGQIFSYYLQLMNARGQLSPVSVRVESSCRLDSGKDGNDPQGKLGLKNLLYNGYIGGTAGNQVLANDASQDYWFDFVAGTHEPGRPFLAASGQAYGLGKFRGHTRWETGDGATGATLPAPKFQNGTEVHFSPPGLGKSWFLWQEIEAWDSNAGVMPALARFRKIKRAGVYVLSAYIAALGGTPPNGVVRFFIEQHNNGTQLGNSERRYRDSSDTLLWTSGDYEISAAALSTEWQRFLAVFRMRTDLSPTRQLHVNLAWKDGTAGGIKMCQAMLNEGEDVGIFTADMGDTDTAWPVNPADPPNGRGDGDGKRIGRYTEA